MHRLSKWVRLVLVLPLVIAILATIVVSGAFLTGDDDNIHLDPDSIPDFRFPSTGILRVKLVFKILRYGGSAAANLPCRRIRCGQSGIAFPGLITVATAHFAGAWIV
jgi:hypothetical protein